MMYAIRRWLVFTAFVLIILPGTMHPCRGADGPVLSNQTAVV